MEADKDADNEELTSTSVPRMEEASSINKEEKSTCSNDSLPTSSTDANTIVKATEQVSDDPISSTSSELDSSKPKSNMSLNIMDNSSVTFDPDAELFGMSVNVSDEKIEENVDDLVSDLETLLGESAETFSMPSKSSDLHGYKANDSHIVQEKSEDCSTEASELVVTTKSPITETNETIEIREVKSESELRNAEIIHQEPIVEETEVTTNLKQATNDFEITIIEEVDSVNKDDAPVSSSSKPTDKNYKCESELEEHSAEASIDALVEKPQPEPIEVADSQTDIAMGDVGKSTSDVSEHQPKEVLISKQSISVEVIESATDHNLLHQQEELISGPLGPAKVETQNILVKVFEAETDNKLKEHREEVSESEPLCIAKTEHIDIPDIDDANQKEEMLESETYDTVISEICDTSIEVIESSIDNKSPTKQDKVLTFEPMELPKTKQLDVLFEPIKASHDAKGHQQEMTELNSLEISAADQLDVPIQVLEASTSDDHSEHQQVRESDPILLSETERLDIPLDICATKANDSKLEKMQESQSVQFPKDEQLDVPIEYSKTSTNDNSKYQQEIHKSESVDLPEKEHIDVQIEVDKSPTNDDSNDQQKVESVQLLEAKILGASTEVGEALSNDDSKCQEEQESKLVQITKAKQLNVPIKVCETVSKDDSNCEKVQESQSVQLLEAQHIDVPIVVGNDDLKHQEEQKSELVQITRAKQLDVPTEISDTLTNDDSKCEKVEESQSVQLPEAQQLDDPTEVTQISTNNDLKHQQEVLASEEYPFPETKQLDFPIEVVQTSITIDSKQQKKVQDPEPTQFTEDGQLNITSDNNETLIGDDLNREKNQQSEKLQLSETEQLDISVKVIEPSFSGDLQQQQKETKFVSIEVTQAEQLNVSLAVAEVPTDDDSKSQQEMIVKPQSEPERLDISSEALTVDESKQEQEKESKMEAIEATGPDQLNSKDISINVIDSVDNNLQQVQTAPEESKSESLDTIFHAHLDLQRDGKHQHQASHCEDLNTNSDIALEILEPSVINPFTEELPVDAAPLVDIIPELNIRRKTVEQDLEKVVCLSEESSDSDSSEAVCKLEKPICEVKPFDEEESDLIKMEVNSVLDPEPLMAESLPSIEEVLAVQPEIVAEANLETILALDAVPMPEMRVERNLSEKEIREMEVIRMAVASITDGPQDVYDAYLEHVEITGGEPKEVLLLPEEKATETVEEAAGIVETETDENVLETATSDLNLDVQPDTVIESEIAKNDIISAEHCNKEPALEQIQQKEVVAAITIMASENLPCEKKILESSSLEKCAIDHTYVDVDGEGGAKHDEELVKEESSKADLDINDTKTTEETPSSELQLVSEEPLGKEELQIKDIAPVVVTPEKVQLQHVEDQCSEAEPTKKSNLTDHEIQDIEKIRLAVASISGASSDVSNAVDSGASNNSALKDVGSNTKRNKSVLSSDLQQKAEETSAVTETEKNVEGTDDFVLKVDNINKAVLKTNIDKEIEHEDNSFKATGGGSASVEKQKDLEKTELGTASIDKKIVRETTPEKGAQVSVINSPKTETLMENAELAASSVEESDCQIMQEKRPRSRSRKSNKISEPLSINVDEIDKVERKEKIYSPKITIKPLKAPEEEVSTTSDAEGNKGSLKMTITKQSATMHSILKVYNPEEDTENLQNQGEPIVPKIIIKQKSSQGDQQHSPKMSTRSSKTYSPTNTRCSSPRMTIKTKCVDVPKETHSPIKITLKSIKPQDDDSPKTQDQKNFMVKPISDEDSLGANPRLTLKVKRHADDAGIDYEPGRSSPKITIKPVIKPVSEQTLPEPLSSTTKLKIKTGKKHDDEDAAAIILQRDQGSPKVLIKTFVKSYDGEDDDESKERIVLKINKGSLPIKETKKREYPDDDKLERQGGIKMKFSTTGGQMHIIQESEDVGNKRQRKDSGYVGGTVSLKKEAEETPSKRSFEDKLPEKNKRLKSSLGDENTEATTDSFKNDRLQSHFHADNNAPPTADISKIMDLASRTTHIESTSVMTVGVATPTVQTPPAPKRRGRPRKVPLQVREELPETSGASSSSFSVVSTPEATPSPGGRPKRSCRGQNVIATLGIKPRKPRGRGRGAKVNMGDRLPVVPMEASAVPTSAPMTAVPEKVHKPPVDAAKEVTLPVRKEENLDFPKVPPHVATEAAPSTSNFVARDNFPDQFNPLKRKAESLLGVEEKRLKVELSSFNQDSDAKQSIGSDDSSKEDDKVSGEEDGDSGDESATEKRREWVLHKKQEAIKKCRAKRMEKLARAAELKKKRQEQAAQQREARKAAEAAEKSRATKRYGRYGIPKPQISLIDEPVRETAGTIKGPSSIAADIESVNVQPVLVDEDSSMDKDKVKASKSLQKDLVDPLALDLADDTARNSLDAEDVVMLDEDTRMSADFRGSRSQTPAKAVLQPDLIIEDSQGSVGTEGGRSRSSKAPKMEVFQDFESTVFMADQLAEYSWNGQGPFMLQEQVAQFLGIKSFKRKYPNISRRPVEMQERDYLKENGLASEALCDLGLTAVIAQDILDIMYTDFQEKYEEYCRAQREKQVREFANKQKALSQYVLKPGYDKMDILEQAVQSAAAWNLQLNKSRREERRAQMDLQSLTIHYPKSRMKPVPVRKIGHYPIALVPGQFTDYYKEFTPTELNNLPLNTMCYEEIKLPVRDSESDRSGSDSDSDSDSTSSSSTSGSSCDEDNCKECIKRETNHGKEMDSDDVVVIENDASSSDSVVLVSVSSAPVSA